MDTFALGKALTRAPPYDDQDTMAKADFYQEIGIAKGIVFTIKSYGRRWRFILRPTHLTAEYIPDGSDKGPLTDEPFHDNTYPPLETNQQLILCCCWTLVEELWPYYYGHVAKWCPQIRLYDKDFLQKLIAVTAWDKRWRSLYRPMCVMLQKQRFEIPYEGGYPWVLTLSEDGRKMWYNSDGCTDEEADVTYEWGCALAYWIHLKGIGWYDSGSDSNSDSDEQ